MHERHNGLAIDGWQPRLLHPIRYYGNDNIDKPWEGTRKRNIKEITQQGELSSKQVKKL